MAVHVIKRGLDLPITGAPEQRIEDAPAPSRVAVMAQDFPLMKARMDVSVGDEVKRGQVLFEDRKSEGVRFTSPGAGKVVAIHRGERRALISVVVELNERERSGSTTDDDHAAFESYTGKAPTDLDRKAVVDLLAESGAWVALRARPFSRVPSPTDAALKSIFVTAVDTRPLAADPDVVVAAAAEDFKRGLQAVAKLTDGPVYLCKKAGSKISGGGVERVREEEWQGKHPAGLVGTHIHFLDPVTRSKPVWHLGYQAVIRIGRLFAAGKLDVEHVVSFAGPAVKSPTLLRTRAGASTDELAAGRLAEGENRIVSGSVLHGRNASGEEHGYLGRYHDQVSCLREGREQVFLGWLLPGGGMFSTVRAFLGSILPGKRFAFSTTTNGSHRAMVPINIFERLMPLDIMPTFLLRALMMDDLQRAEHLGALELDPEDLSLCSFGSPGKEDFGKHLTRNLEVIWKEG